MDSLRPRGGVRRIGNHYCVYAGELVGFILRYRLFVNFHQLRIIGLSGIESLGLVTRGSRQLAFNTTLFSPNALGTFGTSSRRFFYGPGINNYDMALHKVTRLAESTSMEFRFETFNTFNHAQFDGAGSVDGNRDDATFGKILKSQPGRISQVALKLSF